MKNNKTWTKTELKKLCLKALAVASNTIKKIGSAGKVEVVDNDAVNTSSQADHAVSEALFQFFQDSTVPAVLYSEELGKVAHPSPSFLIGWDDIDGTDNWRRAEGSMPYATIIFVYAGCKPKFNDALVAVLCEHISGNIWYAVQGEGCYFKARDMRKFKRCSTSGETRLYEKTAVRIDSFAMRDSGHVEIVDCLIKKSWIKDAGSSGYHFAAVAHGSADAFVNSSCKGHEFGAGYLLITEAGGFVSDWRGNSYTQKSFEFDGKYLVLCAATERLGKEILTVINKKI